jgi:ABC-2 type transport system ATP-binding protein
LDYLRFVGQAKGLKGGELACQIEEVMKQTGIEEVQYRRISTLSKGYKQRVGIAQALLGNPKIIILDEPTVGLDPLQIIEIRDLIKSLGQTHTVIFSSHILSEVQTICDRILMIAGGKLVAFDEPENLEKNLLTPNELVITAEATRDEVTTLLSDKEEVAEIIFEEKEEGSVRAHIKTECKDIYQLSRTVFTAFAQSGKVLLEMNLKKANLEDIFIELTETADPAASLVQEEEQTTPDQGQSEEEEGQNS